MSATTWLLMCAVHQAALAASNVLTLHLSIFFIRSDMSDGSQPNKVIFPRKPLSEVELLVRQKRRQKKINQGLEVSDEEDPSDVVELASGKNLFEDIRIWLI